MVIIGGELQHINLHCFVEPRWPQNLVLREISEHYLCSKFLNNSLCFNNSKFLISCKLVTAWRALKIFKMPFHFKLLEGSQVK